MFSLWYSSSGLRGPPKLQNALGIFHNLLAAELAVAIHSVDEGDGHLSDREALGLGRNSQSHLHGETTDVRALEQLLQHVPLVQPEGTGQVAHAGAQHGVGKDVGALGGKLALEVPAVNTTVAGIAGARDDVVVAGLLLGNHLGDELGVVAEVGVHDNDVVALGELEAVNVGGTESELACAGLQLHMGSVELDELGGDILGAVGRTVVDDYEFPVDVSGFESKSASGNIGYYQHQLGRGRAIDWTGGDILLAKGAVEQPGDDGEVLAFIEGRQDDRVHILAGGLGGSHDD